MEQQPTTNWPPAPPTKSSSGLRDFISFRAFITPAIMSIIWILGAALITFISVVVVLVEVGSPEPFDTFGGPAYGVVWFVLGNLSWRIFVEVLVVVFSIHDTLRKIEKK